MKTKLLKIPCTEIQVLVNNEPFEFEYHDSSYDTYYIGDKPVKVLGALNIELDLKEVQAGDIIFIKSSAGKLVCDGGDENTINVIAELEDFTYGIGGPDTDSIEEGQTKLYPKEWTVES